MNPTPRNKVSLPLTWLTILLSLMILTTLTVLLLAAS